MSSREDGRISRPHAKHNAKTPEMKDRASCDAGSVEPIYLSDMISFEVRSTQRHVVSQDTVEWKVLSRVKGHFDVADNPHSPQQRGVLKTSTLASRLWISGHLRVQNT